MNKQSIYNSSLFQVYNQIFNQIKSIEKISDPLVFDITDEFEDNDYINARFSLNLLRIEIAYQLCSFKFNSLTVNQMYALLGHEFGHYYFKHTESNFSTESQADRYCINILDKLKIPIRSLYDLHLLKSKQLITNNKLTEDFKERLLQAKRFID